jgi:hypothetical protein
MTTYSVHMEQEQEIEIEHLEDLDSIMALSLQNLKMDAVCTSEL